jgi:hypothetical protein
MKKASVFLSVIVIGLSQGVSQNYSIGNDELAFHDAETRAVLKHSKANETIKVTRLNKNGELKQVTSYKFNENNKNSSTIVSDKNGKEKFKRLLNYEGKNLVLKEVFKNEKLKFKAKNIYKEGYNMSYLKINGKDKVLFKSSTVYTNKIYRVIAHRNDSVPYYNRKRAKTTTSYKNGSDKQFNKWEYEYDADGVRTKSTLYGKKNEVKHVWDYSCKSEGELVKVKNETQQCKWDESENGMLVEVIQTTSPKGEIRKTVKKFDADTNIVELIEYKDDVIIRKGTYDKSYYKTLTWESYVRGNLRYKQEYVYDKDGKKTGYKSFWGRNLSKSKRSTNYTYKNDKLVLVNSFKNGEPSKSTKITYN